MILKTLSSLLGVITFKPYRARKELAKRRERYDFLKMLITERHRAGFHGLTVDVQDREFDWTDMLCFRPPMYQVLKNKDMKYCIFWDPKKMSEEIGLGPVTAPIPFESSENTILADASVSTPHQDLPKGDSDVSSATQS